MTEVPIDQPVAEAPSLDPNSDGEGHLPARTPMSAQAIAAVRRLWHDSECNDRRTLENVAAGLRNLDARERAGRVQHEVDGVIARWRAAHSEPLGRGDVQ